MAYVPGFKFDVFISYSHADEPEWVTAFEQNLRESLGRELGVKISIWQDVKKIRLAQDWQGEIEDGIRNSAAFLTIVSPFYRTSPWCTKERSYFLNQFCTPEQMLEGEMPCLDKMKAGSMFRLFKIIKKPWDEGKHEKFLPRLQHASFYRSDVDITEFVPGTEDFRRELRRATSALAELLRRMRSRAERIFVACPAQDMIPVCEKLREQLLQQSYDVRPVGVSELAVGMLDLVPDEIEKAVAAIFVLGAKHDAFVEFQLREVAKLGVRPLIWVDPQARLGAEDKQKTFLEAVLQLEGLPPTTRILTGNNEREMIQTAIRLISAPTVAPEPPPTNGAGTGVYLICDEEDRPLAELWRSEIENQEGLNVFLPSRHNRAERHVQLMKQCEGVLLFRKSAPVTWLNANAQDVWRAEQFYNRPPMRSKVFLIDDPGVFPAYPVQVLSLPGRVDLNPLEPFLSPLRKASAAHDGN